MADKLAIWDHLIESLRAELAATEKAARDAAEHATHEESRAESKWDTQGLEASYLAAGQASKARELQEGLVMLERMRGDAGRRCDQVVLGAMVLLQSQRAQDAYILAPAGGGARLMVEGLEVFAVTPQSPLGRCLLLKRAGDEVSLPNGGSAQVYSIQ